MKSERKENKRREGFLNCVLLATCSRWTLTPSHELQEGLRKNGGVDGAAGAAKMALNFNICDLEQFR